MKAVYQTLVEARKLIDEKGWTQGAMFRSSTGVKLSFLKKEQTASYCMVGALRAQYRPDPSIYGQVQELLHDVIGEEWASLESWNDQPGRTKEEVLAVFDKAIERAKE